MTSRILNVIPKEDYTIIIELDNCHKITYDMKTRLRGIRFCELKDIKKCKSIRIENGNIIIWDELSQISIDEIISHISR